MPLNIKREFPGNMILTLKTPEFIPSLWPKENRKSVVQQTPPFALLGGDQVLSSAFGLVDSSLVCEGPPPLQPLIPFEGHQDSGWVGKGERQGLEIQVKRTHSQNNMGAVPGTGETPLRVAASNTLVGFEKGSLKEVEKGVGKIFSSVSSWFGGGGPPLKCDGPAPRGQPQPYSHSTQSSSHSS